jgi:GT2 family glycosyltransferase
MNKPLVSIIVLNYNGQNFVIDLFNSLLKTTYPNFEIIFVDNASTDDSIKKVRENYGTLKNLKIIRNDKNYGYAKGNNIGLSFVQNATKYIVFLNADTIVTPNWLDELVSYMEKDLSIAAAQCKVLLLDKKTIDSAGHFLDFLLFTYQLGEDENDNEQYNHIYEITYPYGAAFILRKSILHSIKLNDELFDEDYFCYHEDADLGLRIRLAGYKIIYIPTAIVYHAKGGSKMRYDVVSLRSETNIVFHLTKNRLASLFKNYSILNVFRFLPLLLFLDLARAIGSIFLISKQHSYYTLKAIFWFFKNLKTISIKRSFVQNNIRKVSDGCILRYMFKPYLRYNIQKLRSYVRKGKEYSKLKSR